MSETADKESAKFQYSLRALLVLVTVAAPVAMGIAWYINSLRSYSHLAIISLSVSNAHPELLNDFAQPVKFRVSTLPSVTEVTSICDGQQMDIYVRFSSAGNATSVLSELNTVTNDAIPESLGKATIRLLPLHSKIPSPTSQRMNLIIVELRREKIAELGMDMYNLSKQISKLQIQPVGVVDIASHAEKLRNTKILGPQGSVSLGEIAEIRAENVPRQIYQKWP